MMTRKHWTAILATGALILAVIIVVIALDRGSGASMDLAAMETEIQASLSDQTHEEVASVDCIRKSSREASCVATFSDGSTAPVAVDVDADGETFIWRVQ